MLITIIYNGNGDKTGKAIISAVLAHHCMSMDSVDCFSDTLRASSLFLYPMHGMP